MPTKKRKLNSSERKAKFLKTNRFRPVIRVYSNYINNGVTYKKSTTLNSEKYSSYYRLSIKYNLVISEE